MKQTKVGIIGNGWVSRSMQKLFPEALVYVRDLNKYADDPNFSHLTDKKSEINKCDVAFIAVPTPLGMDGRLDTSIVRETISWLKTPLIVIRSTCNPGDTYRWRMMFKKAIVFQVEYLGETPAHPHLDEKNIPFLVIAGSPPDRRRLIELYTTVYNANIKIRQVDDFTGEVIKLAENRAIAFKVMQAQELYDICEKANVDYYTVVQAVYGDDPRFNLFWTFIYPSVRGFHSSRCLSKDVPAFAAWADSLGYNAVLTKALIKKSEQYNKQNKRRQKAV